MSAAEIFETGSSRIAKPAAPAPAAPQSPADQNPGDQKPANQNRTDAVPFTTWLAVIGAALGAFLAVLNIQIVNSSLADIQGAIGAGIDDGGWISTAYLIPEIIVIPLSGWLARVFSMRTYLLVNTVLFLAFSVACAFAGNLSEMIVLRAFQGFTGGVLIRSPSRSSSPCCRRRSSRPAWRCSRSPPPSRRRSARPSADT
jgi:DHA2 family multidrug resistance protein